MRKSPIRSKWKQSKEIESTILDLIKEKKFDCNQIS